MRVFRGEIYFCCLDPVFGREAGGFKTRPVVVISANDIHNQTWGVVTVVPGTSNTKFKGKNLVLVHPNKRNGLETEPYSSATK